MRPTTVLCTLLLVIGMILVLLAPDALADVDAGPSTQPSAPATVSVPATPGQPTPLASQALSELLKIIAAIATIFVLWLARKVILVLETKAGVDVPVKIEEQIDSWVQQGIGLAEEKAAQLMKTKLAGMRGPEKLEVAGNFVMSLITQHGIVGYARDKILQKIEAALGVQRVAPTPPPLPPAP